MITIKDKCHIYKFRADFFFFLREINFTPARHSQSFITNSAVQSNYKFEQRETL
jgi:hypothetical protein